MNNIHFSRQIKKTEHLARTLGFVLITTVSLLSCSFKGAQAQIMNQPEKSSPINMKKILIIGMNPRTINFTNPELPQGLNADIIEKGTKATLEQLTSMGYHADIFLIDTGTTDLSALAKELSEKNYDGIVIGNGIRGIKANFLLFEKIVNAVHTSAPKAKIIFNSLPTDTAESIQRWL